MERQTEVTERLVFLLPGRIRPPGAFDEFLGLPVSAGEDQLPDFREGFGALTDKLGFVRASGPKRVLVELKTLFPDAAENHGPELAVADRKGFRPLDGRHSVPELEFVPIDISRFAGQRQAGG